MADFEVYVDDDRYSVPTLYLIAAMSEHQARAKAQEVLDASDHHQGVELLQDGERLFALGSFAMLGREASDRRDAPAL
jgi:uncharacterized protein YmfQ (DUF2313 family)